MRVDLAEQTLSKEVEDALILINELKEISDETREFIKYSRKYRSIMHSKINFQSLEDTRLNTLKEIRNWFIHGDNQKTEYKEWISSQCQLDLILSIDGFLGMLNYMFNKYPGSMVQPKRISQDLLEGFFGTIRELGGDSSTQTLNSYGYALNKYKITALFSSEVKSLNYGNADNIGTGITKLARRDYRKDKNKLKDNKENKNICQKHSIRLVQLSNFSQRVFEDLLNDELIMGELEIPLNSYNKNVDRENLEIFNLQYERYKLIETILYKNSIDELLQNWHNIVKKIAHNAIPKRKGTCWLTNWSSHLEIYLNNYQCSGVWYQDFLVATNIKNSKLQRLVAYLLLQRVIKLTFNKTISNNNLSADKNYFPEKIITLEPPEASKFSYIVGWIIYKLIRNNSITKSHPKYEIICAHLKVLSSGQVVYEKDIRSQVTNIIPGRDFLSFMSKIESLILLLFEMHENLGPNILQYISNSLLNNIPTLESFNNLLNISTSILISENKEKQELDNNVRNFLYERIISIYMRSRQKSWWRFYNLIPEKETASLRENFKLMNQDTRNSNKIENKNAPIKKSNLPMDPKLALIQLQMWAKSKGAEEEFSKIFLVTELQWLIWALGDNTKNKRKKNLVPLILNHLKNETPFSQEALAKEQMFI
ncbi:hypothetical protein Glove_117g324 [Diversispora epigaea]|uniref:Uncharacterized protein n=1 Tax=Diversispora epigaea TaxID=1348612 RepID=A0A397JAG3_9GLOM|nr:hypothetical protein Glove_117g324 [Diversispora epigaea]